MLYHFIKELDFPDLEFIKEIRVEVITGDEVVTLIDTFGNVTKYDSSDSRKRDFYDSDYYLTTLGEILKWINSSKLHEIGETISYERAPSVDFSIFEGE